MKKEIISIVSLLILIVSLTPSTFAGERDKAEDGEDNFVYHKPIYLQKKNKKKIAHLVISKDGHGDSQFLVEIRPTCKGVTRWEGLDVYDMDSACDVYLDTVEVNKDKTKISIMVGKIDSDDYNKQSKKNPDNIKPKCVRGKVLEFSLKRYCKK